MSIVLFIGFFMSLFLIIILAGKNNKSLPDKILLCMLSIYAITIGGPYIEIYNRLNNYPYPHLMNHAWLFLLLHGPLLWLYVRSLIDGNFKFKYIYLLHLLPFVVFSVFHVANFFFLPVGEKISLVTSEAYTNTYFFKIRGLFIGISTIGYNIWALILLQRHIRNIKNQFSTIENIDLRWLKTLVIASLIVFSVNVLLFNINNYVHFSGYFELAQIAYSFSTVYVLYMGYFGLKQGKIFVDYPSGSVQSGFQSAKAARIIPKVTKDYMEIRNNLIKIMEQQQPYLNPELNLSGLSKLVKVKPEVLSDVLNTSLNQNFFDFVNKYRIEEFKLKCLNKKNSHLSVMGNAYDCGFNSKAAFYRAFNKFEGISPTTYISKVS